MTLLSVPFSLKGELVHTSSAQSLLSTPKVTVNSICPHFMPLEFAANDIEHFDPDSCDHNYTRELDHALIDSP